MMMTMMMIQFDGDDSSCFDGDDSSRFDDVGDDGGSVMAVFCNNSKQL